MTHTLTEFFADWKNESAATLKIMNELTDASLKQRVSPEGRTLGRLAWHIIQTLGEMGKECGLTVDAPPDSIPVPAKASLIAEAYEKSAISLATAVQEQWTDAMLGEEIGMYGQKWKRGFALDAMVRHEIHHRAQMTVLMRQANLKVPGVYGPAKEEWSAIGMQPML